MNRRDLLLNEMNICQWVLRKPQVLKGDAQIRLSPTIKLVIVCEENHQQSRFFQDILHTLQLNVSEYQWLNFEQAMRLSFSHQPIFWLIQPDAHAVRFSQKFAKLTVWRYPNWQQLHQPTTKRQLWQQLQPCCQHFEDIL